MLGVDLRAARYTWTAALVLLLLGVIYLIREALLVFVIALLFAYLLYPLMDLIDRHMTAKTRTPALTVTFLLVIGILTGFGFAIGSVVVSEAVSLTAQAPALLARIEQPPAPPPNGVRSIKNDAIAFVQTQLREHYGDIALQAPRLGLRILTASGNLIYLIIIPILSFLILRDGRSIRDGFLEMLDTGQEVVRNTLADVHELLLLYMRSLLFLCCATFVSFIIVLSAMGVPYAVLLASIAFPLEFIPLVGPLSAAAIIITVSAVSGYAHVLWVVIYLGLYRLFQDYVLSPHLMSQGVELHPLMIIFGVFAGGLIGGIAGIFLSIPVLALLRLLYHRARKAQAARHLQPTV
ncbi:MAG TPA: AI-2E family transporter [Bryobacteraceae bacterium]|nr:AI-2E family transporter [Bryobacteraceae bacterium]